MPSSKTIIIGLSGAIFLGMVGGGLILPSLLLILASILLLLVGLVAMFVPRVLGFRSRWVALAVAGLSIPCLSFAVDDGTPGLNAGPFTLTLWLFAVGAVGGLRYLRRKAADEPAVERSNQSTRHPGEALD